MADPEPQVLAEVDPSGVARLVLNRPRVINALTRQMIDQLWAALTAWATDERVRSVELSGAGERGLCSGADVVVLREQMAADPQSVKDFFVAEYRLNEVIATYPKPYTATLDGITMGGGLGVSLHAARRVGTSTSRLAMPETVIGFFPDVGALHHLTRMPGLTGLHLALTGSSVDAAGAYWAGLLDEVDELTVHPDDSELARARRWIDDCYDADSAAGVVQNLEAHPDEVARAAAQTLRQRSPWAVAVTFEAYRRARAMTTAAEVLAQDLVIAHHFVDESDFAEGVRAQLVDKDKNPWWRHSDLESVPRDLVEGAFEAAVG